MPTASVSALILAAGLSTRMGVFKLTLPWQDRTVIGQVVQVLQEAGVSDIVAVLGHRAAEVQAALAGAAVRFVYNAHYDNGAMLDSIRAGLTAVTNRNAVLLCLGDQPQMLPATVRAVLEAGAATGWERIIIPSYNRRAGHPILLPRTLWEEVRTCPGVLRDVLRAHQEQVQYLVVDTPTVLADLDTPDDYRRQQRLTEME